MSSQEHGYLQQRVLLCTAGISDTPIVNTIEFLSPCSARTDFNATSGNRALTVPVGMTLHGLVIEHDAAQAVTVMVVTVDIDTNITAITLDIPLGVAGTTSDLVNRVHINAGQQMNLRFTSQAGATNAKILSLALIGDLDG